MLKRLEVFLIAAVFILMTAIILIVYSKQREKEFEENNQAIQKTVVSSAAHALNIQLLEKQRHVHLFVNEYAQLFVLLNSNPANDKIHDEIITRLKNRFPDFFTFTITDAKGVPKLFDIDSLVGNVCQVDLTAFSKDMSVSRGKPVNNLIYIHPQPFNYHYDIMSPLFVNTAYPSIFFISFYLDDIAATLKTREVPGLNLMLVKQSDPSLIEVTNIGARDKLKRDIHLSEAEQRQISVYEDIPGTDWRLVNLPDPQHKIKYFQGIWIEALTILIVVSFAMFLLVFSIIKAASKRRK